MSFTEIISSNKLNFLKYNSLKFERFQELFPNKNVARIINSIPLLLSVNDKKIPGFVEGDVPYGIMNYEPDAESVKFLQGRFRTRSFKYEYKAPVIRLLAVMGSIGTIAYNKKSDFDYWICVYRKSIKPAQFEKFEKKISLITKWVNDESRVEVNFFINDIDNIKINKFADTESESLGSTLGSLLKDEFFRSSIIICGLTPFWWVIPRFIGDSEYARLYDSLTDEMKENEYIDLGNLFDISREEFLGAVLFQIIKSLGNPFKSIIKIGVLEKYLFESEYSPLLSHKIKTKILRGVFDNDILDSYIQMFEEVYQYYSTAGRDANLLNILRENLYLKINPHLSKYIVIRESKNLPYNVRVMFKYVGEWKWPMEKIRELDNFNNWDYSRVMLFWNGVKKFILSSYQKIAKELPNLNIKEKISDTDFQILSRKIQTHFSVRENKIDQYITFKDTPYESVIYIEPVSLGTRETEWKYIKNATNDKDEITQVVVKAETSMVKLLAWLSINRIFDPKFSRVKIKSGYQRLDQNHVLNMLTAIWELFSDDNMALNNEFYQKPAFSLVNLIIINSNTENQNEIKSIHHIYHTSWGESFIDEYDSGQELMSMLRRILEDGIKTGKSFSRFMAVVYNQQGGRYFRSIEKLFQNSYGFIVHEGGNSCLSMIARQDESYYCITRDDKNGIEINSYKYFIQLLTYQSLKPKIEMKFRFYGEDEQLVLMDYIISRGKKNHITIVYEEKGGYIFLYLINERGNLFTYARPSGLKEKALASLYTFSRNSIGQLNSFRYFPDINSTIPVFRVYRDRDGEITSDYETDIIEKSILGRNINQNALDVEISSFMTNENFYRIIFSNDKSTELLPLNRIGDTLKTYEELAAGTFIRKIKFSDYKRGYFSGGTNQFFLEKYRLELIMDRLNK